MVARNTRRKQGAPFLYDLETFFQRHCKEYGALTGRYGDSESFLLDAGFTLETTEHPQQFDREGLRGRLLSASVVPLPGQPGYEAMSADLDLLFDAHARDGLVTLLHDTKVYYARI